MINQDKLEIARRILNCFENDSASPETDYSSIYIYSDGNNGRKQVTLARGFTQDGGNLWKVLSTYISKNGQYANFFAGYKNEMSNGNLYKDADFLKTLIKSSKEEILMQQSQDEVFDKIYLSGAINYFENYKFTLPMSLTVIFDSTLQSGGMLSKLTNRFAEKKPSFGGEEKKWIHDYIFVRNDWLSNSSNRAVRNSSYRTRFFLTEINNDNWNLDPPIIANGSKVS